MFWLYVDLDELGTLDRSITGFGYNRRALVSIRDADYAGGGAGDIRTKVLQRLQREGISEPIARVVLVTLPRVCGYVFNPVSIYLCHGADDALTALVAEVHNTFDQEHHYVIRPEPQMGRQDDPIRFRVPKSFYVSPFLDVAGEYEIRLTNRPDHFSMQIALLQQGDVVFTAAMRGTSRELTGRRLTWSLIRLPMCAAAVMFRIHWQALRLYMTAAPPVFARPEIAGSASTPPARTPNLRYRITTCLVRRAAEKQQTRPGAPGVPRSQERA